MNDQTKNRTAVQIFVVVALGLSVLHWLIFYFARQVGWEPPKGVFGVIRSFGPTIAAVAALAYAGGKPAIRDLWSRVIHWRISSRLYVIVLLGMLAVLALTLGVVEILKPGTLVLDDINPLKLVAIFVVLIFLDGPLGEEPGWRGFLLPTLMKRYNALVASLIVAFVWYLWHLPLYHADGRDLSGDFLLKYLIFTIALSMMHTWLYQRSGGSVFLNVLFHNTTNYVVLVGFTLFPALKDTKIDNYTYLYIMLVIGAVAAWALRRHQTNRSPRNTVTSSIIDDEAASTSTSRLGNG